MSIAYWCILIVAMLPFALAMFAKSGPGYDNRNPRAWQQQQGDPRKQRAYAAHLNTLEAFPAFAAAVLMAQLANVDSGLVAMLASAFVVLRVLYGVLYIANVATLRSLVWAGGLVCVLALMGLAAIKVA